MGALRWNGPGSWKLNLPNGKSWKSLPMEDDFLAARACQPEVGYLLRFRHPQNPEHIVEIHPVGIGEIFVVAGQSNSANHGEVSLAPLSDRVVAKADQHWQLARDPQPGASGRGGSFMPPLGDVLAQALGVPIGFVACGIGATSVLNGYLKEIPFLNLQPFGACATTGGWSLAKPWGGF